MKRLLQGAEVWRDGGFVRADVLVDGDRIAAVGPKGARSCRSEE